jgi:exodeoxyribonuclease V gamma subunit
LPFRVVVACGLGEGRFPAPEPDDPLDLRGVRRREGELTARDRDRGAFLELLLGSRDRLLLSYVSRDALTGQSLPPSSVVQELMHALADGYVDDVGALRRTHPLRRWDPRYFPDLFGTRESVRRGVELPEARAEARTLALRRDLEAHAAAQTRGAAHDAAQTRGAAHARPEVELGPEEIAGMADRDPAWEALASHLGVAKLPGRRAAAPASAPASAQTRLAVPLAALVKFLEFPLQAWARFRLGLTEMDDSDPAAVEDELFETHYRNKTLFLRSVLLSARAEGKTIEQAYDEASHERELRGAGPLGAFARAERGAHLAALETWRDQLESEGVPLKSIEVLRFGRGSENAPADRAADPLVLDVDYVDASGVTRIVQVEVAGRTLPLGADASASLTLTTRPEPGDKWARAERMRAALRAFVDHAVLAATEVAPPHEHASLAVFTSPEGGSTDAVRFAALSRDEATGWLRVLARDLVSGPHAYFLPCEAVFVHRSAEPAVALRSVLEQARAKLKISRGPLALRSAYGPVPRPHEAPIPDEAHVREMVSRRYGVLFAKWEAGT